MFHDAARERGGRAGAPVVVHVHSVGVEQITLYREEVLAARAAASRGFASLRWHARGHGDSAGTFADVTFDSLVEDARAAADEARRRSGASKVIWLGVRFGALVAAHAAAGRDDAAGFVLWEPASSGADFFRQQLRTLLYSRVAGGKKPDATVEQTLERIEREGCVDVFGYHLYRAFVNSARERTLESAFASRREPVRLAQIQQRGRLTAPHQRFVDALAARGVDVATACVHEEPGYQMLTNPAWESETLTRQTTEWLDALA